VRLHASAELDRDSEIRELLVLDRIGYKPSDAELMDLTRFMHGGPGELASCQICGLVVRREDDQPYYETDQYDRELLEVLYPRYRGAFESKMGYLHSLLPSRAEVVEVGSHTGAFLEVAENAGWRPTGLDIGEDTSTYAIRRGLRVHRESLHDARLPTGTAHGVFIWNCFEQIGDPKQALSDTHRILQPGGVLVVRVPNLAYYERYHRRRAFVSLVHQNLLGFPYQHGYTPATLGAAMRAGGFQVLCGIDSNLLTSPFPQWTHKLERERRRACVPERVHSPDKLSGPWIELVCRRMREGKRKAYVY
jgi:SAM-dependent methyltransferase